MKRLLFGLALVAIGFAAEPAAKLGALTPGTLAPEFTVVGIDGKDVKLSDFKGKAVVLNFWKTNRGPAETLQTVFALYGDMGAVVIAVCSGATRADFDKWVEKTKDHVTYVLAWDPAGVDSTTAVATRLFGVNSFPATGVIGKDGKILGGFIGFSGGTTVALRGFLREAGLPIPPEEQPKLADAPPPPPDNALKAGELAPDFTTNDLAGKPVRLSDFAGKIVVLDFWATWCGPCIASMPHTQSVAAATKNQDVVVLASCTSDLRMKFESWLGENGAKYPDLRFALDPAERGPERASAKLYHVDGIPTQFVIGRDGRVTNVIVGFGPGDTRLEEALKKLGVNVAAH